MKRLRFDEIKQALPEIDELQPLVDLALRSSSPDTARAWAGSGELETVGARLVDGEGLAEAAKILAFDVQRHLTDIYGAVTGALRHLEAGRAADAALEFLRAASMEESRDHPAKAMAYSIAAHRAVQAERDRSVAGLALTRWARAARAQGHLAEAERRYGEAYEVGVAISDARAAAEAAVGAGNVLEQQGRWDGATEWYQRALTLLDSVESPTPERWHALLNLHIVLRSRGDLRGSVGLLEEAERVAGALQDPAAPPFLQNARGQLAMAEGSLAEAEAQLRAALGASSDNTGASVTIRLNLAEALLAQERTLDAAEQAREAERAAVGAGLVAKLPEVYRLLGRIASSRGNPDAFVLFERALEIIRERKLPIFDEALTLQAYAESELRRGETEAAAALQGRAQALYDSLGIEHARHAWADVFGPSRASANDERASEHRNDNHGSTNDEA